MHGVNKNVVRVVFVQKFWGSQSLENCTRQSDFLPLLDPGSGAETLAVSQIRSIRRHHWNEE